MNQKGSVAVIISIIVVTLLALLGGLYLSTMYTIVDWKIERVIGPGLPPLDNSKSELEIITNLKANWQSIQALISFRPGWPPEATIWMNPFSVQFIGKNNLLVGIEDGHTPNIVVLNFDNGKFKVLETFRNQADFTLSDWQNLVRKYGDLFYSPSSYSIDDIQNGKIISFPDLTKVSENVFLKIY